MWNSLSADCSRDDIRATPRAALNVLSLYWFALILFWSIAFSLLTNLDAVLSKNGCLNERKTREAEKANVFEMWVYFMDCSLVILLCLQVLATPQVIHSNKQHWLFQLRAPSQFLHSLQIPLLWIEMYWARNGFSKNQSHRASIKLLVTLDSALLFFCWSTICYIPHHVVLELLVKCFYFVACNPWHRVFMTTFLRPLCALVSPRSSCLELQKSCHWCFTKYGPVDSLFWWEQNTSIYQLPTLRR